MEGRLIYCNESQTTAEAKVHLRPHTQILIPPALRMQVVGPATRRRQSLFSQDVIFKKGGKKHGAFRISEEGGHDLFVL